MVSSWYGPGLEGGVIASGEVFEPYSEYTAAHPYLPMGTELEVCYETCTVVRVNDRDRTSAAETGSLAGGGRGDRSHRRPHRRDGRAGARVAVSLSPQRFAVWRAQPIRCALFLRVFRGDRGGHISIRERVIGQPSRIER
jgi:hypothetical protein